jgi:hypothetical protein
MLMPSALRLDDDEDGTLLLEELIRHSATG